MNDIMYEENEKEMQRKKITENYFDEIAGDYDNSYDGKFVRCMYDEIVARVLQKNPADILDLGCGNGNVLGLLQQKSDANLCGIDLSEKMIKQARQRFGNRVELQVGDAEKLQYREQQFDVIICNASFHHYIHPDIVIAEIKRVLKPQGTLILGDPTAPFEWYLRFLNWGLKWINSGDYHIYGKNEITKLLEQHGFTVSRFKKISNRTFILNARLVS